MHPSASRIDRYLQDDLPSRAGDKLRSHLRDCQDCREHYDRQVILLRALAGDAENPTRQEDERMVRLALQAAGLPPEREPEEKRSMPYIPVPAFAAAAVLLVVVLALGLWLALRPAEPVISAQLIKAKNLTLDGVAADTRIFKKIPIRSGEKLAVEKRGFAELLLVHGGKVRIYSRTALSLSGTGERVDLGIGKVWCIVKPSAKSFVVRTDVAEARVVGTSFVVERERDGDTEVRVMKGEVEVKNVKQEEKVRVRSGKRTRVAADKPPTPPRRYDPEDDESQWDAFVRELKLGVKRAIRDIQEFFNGE
jgi:ferric-dicitrate binding protein FerR (iron transport regulator)